MTVRPPSNFGHSDPTMSGLATLEYELMAERANALGRHGAAVEEAIKALKKAEDRKLPETELEQFRDVAAEAVWGLFVHRGTCGLHNGEDVIKDYDIPGKVIARLGASRRQR